MVRTALNPGPGGVLIEPFAYTPIGIEFSPGFVSFFSNFGSVVAYHPGFVSLQIYKATESENSCTFAIAKPPLNYGLKLAKIEPEIISSDSGIAYLPPTGAGSYLAIAVCCRPNYRSNDFPENPRYTNL